MARSSKFSNKIQAAVLICVSAASIATTPGTANASQSKSEGKCSEKAPNGKPSGTLQACIYVESTRIRATALQTGVDSMSRLSVHSGERQ